MMVCMYFNSHSHTHTHRHARTCVCKISAPGAATNVMWVVGGWVGGWVVWVARSWMSTQWGWSYVTAKVYNRKVLRSDSGP